LSEILGCEIVLKCETVQPIGAFKVRGGINLLHHLSKPANIAGVVTASTGNHAQSIAYAAKRFGVSAVIFMPKLHNPLKAEATRRLGAEVIAVGSDVDQCRQVAEEYALERQLHYVHYANEPLLIAGVGTMALELIEAEPNLDVVISPVGGGSALCGTAIVFKTLRPETRVIGVQAEGMPSVYRSFQAGRLIETEGGSTWAEGLATRVTFPLPLGIMREFVDDIVLVSDEAMRRAMIMLLEHARVVAEGAGSAALAAATKLREDLRGKRVGVIVSGGNVTLETLRRALCDSQSW
jgi:threonine dehydratase